MGQALSEALDEHYRRVLYSARLLAEYHDNPRV
jgi:hypothetical protein